MTNPPIGLRLQPNMIITNEVSAVWGHQVSQEDQPIVLGPVPEAWQPVIELQRECFEVGLERMTPGSTIGEFVDFANGYGAQRGMRTMVLMHGRGYGDDGPLLVREAQRSEAREVRFEKGNAFVWKPIAASADGKIQFTWGGDVVVTERGGERLFRRPHGMVSVA
jgi:Xaa-Pro aminopeptidase